MTPEEQLAEFRKQKQLAQFRAAKAAAAATAEPEVAVAEPKERPSLLRQAAHVAKGVGRGIVDLTIDLPHNLTTVARIPLEWAAEKVGVELPNISGSPSPFFGTFPRISDKPYIKDVLDPLTSESVTREEAPVADALRTGAIWMVGLPANNAAKLATKADVIMAGGAAAGDYLQSVASDSNSPAGQLIGGITGLIAGLRAGKPPKPGEVDRSLDFIKKNSDNPDQLVANVEERVAAGDKGTLADLSGEQGLYNVEAGLSLNPEVQRQIDAAAQMRAEQQGARYDNVFPDAPPGAAVEAAAERVTNRKGRVRGWRNKAMEKADAAVQVPLRQNAEQAATIEQRAAEESRRIAEAAAMAERRAAEARQTADTASVGARESALPLATNKSPAQASTDLRNLYDEAATDFNREVVNPAWDEFKAQPAIDINPVKKAVSDMFREKPLDVRKAFNKKYGKYFTPLRGKHNALSAEAFQDVLLGPMRAAAKREIDAGGFSPLPPYIKAIEDSMAASNDLLREAKAATTTKYDRFYPENVGKAMDNAPPEKFAKAVGFADEAGEQSVRTMGQSQIPGLGQSKLEYLKAEGARRGIDEKFLLKHKGMLESLPPADRAQFEQYVQKTNSAKLAEKEAAKAEKLNATAQTKATREESQLARSVAAQQAKVASEESRLQKSLAAEQEKITAKRDRLVDAVDKTTLASYANKPEATLTKLTSTTDNIPALTRLGKKLDAIGQGDSFRAAVAAKLKDGILSGKNPNANRILQESGLADRAQIEQLESIAKMSEGSAMRKQATAVYEELHSKNWNDLVASGLAAASLHVLPGSHQLIMAGALRRYFQNMLKKPVKDDIAVLNTFMLDPAKYLDAAKNSKTGAYAAESVLTKMVGASRAAAIMNQEED